MILQEKKNQHPSNTLVNGNDADLEMMSRSVLLEDTNYMKGVQEQVCKTMKVLANFMSNSGIDLCFDMGKTLSY